MPRAVLLALLAAAGCYGPWEDDADVFVVPPGVDAEWWGPPPGEFDYLEGERLVVDAFFVRSGKLKRPTCEIAVVGDTVTIQTSVKYKRRNDGALWHAHARCQTGPMDPAPIRSSSMAASAP